MHWNALEIDNYLSFLVFLFLHFIQKLCPFCTVLILLQQVGSTGVKIFVYLLIQGDIGLRGRQGDPGKDGDSVRIILL